MSTQMIERLHALEDKVNAAFLDLDPGYGENQEELFKLRYSLKNEKGEPTESPGQEIGRVGVNVSIVNVLYAGQRILRSDGQSTAKRVDRSEVPFPFKTAVRQYNWLVKHGKITHPFEEVITSGLSYWLAQAEQYQEIMAGKVFVPNSPTHTGAGTELGQLAACFVLPIADDLGRSRDSIFETLKVAVLIQQTGGGNGFPLHFMRPSKALVSRSMGEASGPMSFLEVLDTAFGKIAQGGTRRGANMGVMRVSHPDILDFIRAKVVEGVIANFNLSVAIEDAFMEAVEKGEKWPLQHGGKVYREVDARELYDEIIRNAWVIGDPGNLFIDRANRDNPVPFRYTLEATNPCGEQWLGPYENCCLGSIHVGQFADWDEGFDWEGLRAAVEMSTKFLDDVVDANAYVPEIPELEEAAQGGRRIGLGLMGVDDALKKLGLRYGSPDALDFCSQLIEFARYHCMLTSIERAEERGPFGWIENSIYDPKLLTELGPGGEIHGELDGQPKTAYLWKPPVPFVEHLLDFGRPECDWSAVVEGIKLHGIRNSCQFTFAPTGTISNIAGCESSGCEPIFALFYVRTVMQERQNIKQVYMSSLFETALIRAGVSDEDRDTIRKLLAKKEHNGSCQNIELVPPEVRKVFAVAGDITPEEHVLTQAVFQAFIDNSISKTINLPNSATPEDVSTAYQLAYKSGCKGITVYRQGSRELEVLSTDAKPAGETGELEVVDKDHWPYIEPMAIPGSAEELGLPSRTYPVQTPFGKMQVTVTELDEHLGRPFDTRITFGKAGNDKAADMEAIGRLVSLLLRAGVNLDHIVDQLEGLGGATRTGFRDKKVLSSPDGLAKLLKRRYRPDQWARENATPTGNGSVTSEPPAGDEVTAVLGEDLCPKCKNYTVVHRQGCKYCLVELGGCGEKLACE